MMGIDIDGLGNHNFDRGAAYMQNTLIPLATFPFVSANVRRRAREHAAAVVPVARVRVPGNGVTLGFVGFTNDDAPTLTKPGSFDPFIVPLKNSTQAVNEEAARIAESTDAVVAMGHLGATGGTLTAPTGPLIDLADNVSNVDARDR